MSIIPHLKKAGWALAWALGLVTSVIAYAFGVSVPATIAIAAGVPAAHAAMKLCDSRILTYAIAVATFVAVWETGEFRKIDLFYGAGTNYVDVLEELYPDRPETLFERALQVTTCKMDPDKWQSAGCPMLRTMPNRDLQKLYRRAFASGIKANENQLYTYAVALILLDADEAEIEKAVVRWKESFPASDAPPPHSWARPMRD